jgi:hypothetical protein
MKQYKHKITKELVKADQYKKGKEDGFQLINNKLSAYIKTTITGELLIEFIKKGDYILYYETRDRIFKGVYPKKIFKKFYEEVKE